MKTVGTTSGTQSHSAGAAAILSNARLATDVSAPMATPIETLPQPEPAPRDSYEPTQTRTDRPTNAELDSSRSDANPFDGLERGDAADVRLSEQSVDLAAQLDADHAQMTRLNSTLLAMSRAGKEIPTSLLEGFLMNAHDAQNTEPPMNAKLKAEFAAYTTKLAAGEATEADHKSFWTLVAASNENVMAYVQRALRESYTIANASMLDMADDLKKTNELRKKIREEASKARKTQASWASQSNGDDTWVSSTPYGAMRVNETLGELEPDTMDEDELAEYQAEVEAQASDDDTSDKTDISAALASLDGDSRLTDKQRFQLGNIVQGNDEAAKDNIDLLIAAIPSMNAADLRTYLEPILDNLTDGNTDEDEILQVFGALDAAQMLTVVADGYTENDKFKFKGDDASKFRDLTVTTLFDYVDQSTDTEAASTLDEISALSEGIDEATAGGILGQLAGGSVGSAVGAVAGLFTGKGDAQAKKNQLDSSKAAELLAAFKSQTATTSTDSSTTTDGAKVGDQRTMNTEDELDAYVEGLEDEINSIGDDAQLQQVDLQNALQKNQQTMQMMSNLLKVVHDTIMAVIRNANS